ncbi:hypothetical protein [Candidatus Leptofilum sp.]|uniref:hypothetical protein n=1 Tax=Candidatus Leptofilum sp. TaxID=3241576 RepID=UPI003B5B23D1
MTRTIFIKNQRYKLDAADLIQSGGEGMVFGLESTAVKLYHHPTPNHQAKLQHWFAKKWQLPANVLAPCATVQNKRGQIIGLQMARLPAHAQPIKRLSQPHFWQQHALRARQIVPLLQQLHQTLNRLHQLQIVVGDLNDTNIFFTLPDQNGIQPFWIDVDSYQFGSFPCPVAMLAFLDPMLYHVTNFSKRPYFTPLTDWYAFAVLLVKSLLQVHPYGGVHRQHKTIQARASAGISLFNSSVTLPPNARPPETLSDDLLHYLDGIFTRGERRPFPLQLLQRYAQSLRRCPHCGLDFPANRRGCPACRHPVPAPTPPANSTQPRIILRVNGFIEAVFGQPNGRLLIIYRQGEQVRLVRAGIGGTLSDEPLFSGKPGYRFGTFTLPNGHDFLVVNPPHRPQLLLLDIHATQPRQMALLETAMFKEAAVFATSPHHLYRISGGWIMRGTVKQGSYLEEPIGTAHRAQTQLFGDPHSDRIAGFHRIFAQHQFFTISPNGTERPLPVTQPPNSHLTQAALIFAPNQIGVVQQLVANGQAQTNVQTFNHQTQWQQSWDLCADDWEAAVHQFPFIQQSFPQPLTPSDKLHFHRAGWLIQQTQQLVFIQAIF